MLKRHCLKFLAAGLPVVLLSLAPAGCKSKSAQSEPAASPAVEAAKTEFKPYTATIPGTDIAFSMVAIQGGKFKIGSPESEKGREDHEGPQAEVAIEPFWMGKHEVTWAEFKALHPESGKIPKDRMADAVTSPTPLYDPSFTYELGSEPNEPAVSMTQFTAKQYTKWLSRLTGHFYRIPTEAEWEYACRAGTTTAYYFGDDAKMLGDYEWVATNGNEKYHPVGTKKPNPWGLHDMHGNVSEWVMDGYHKDGFKHIPAGATWEKAILWPKTTHDRVLRGGNFESDPETARSASRYPSEPQKIWAVKDPNRPRSPWWNTEAESRMIGFRIIRPLKEPTESEKAKYWEADVDDIKDAVADRMAEGRGALGLVDKDLPKRIQDAADAIKKAAIEDEKRLKALRDMDKDGK